VPLPVQSEPSARSLSSHRFHQLLPVRSPASPDENRPAVNVYNVGNMPSLAQVEAYEADFAAALNETATAKHNKPLAEILYGTIPLTLPDLSRC